MSDLISRQAAISIPLTPKGLRKYQTCNLDDAYDEGWGDYQARVSQLPSAQHWIPCSERLPEKDEQVFVYLFDDSPYIAWICGGRWHTEEFTLDKDEEPAAWMPLPEPYEERREE